MKFFDPKQDVVDLQITQHGKHLLSKGNFKPVFYAFFDDDILYDGTYSGNEEIQNDTEPRIQEETPRLRTQYVFSGRESDIQEHTEHYIKNSDHRLSSRTEFTTKDEDRWMVQPTMDNHHNQMLPLGTAELSARNIPAWSIKFLKGEMTGTSTHTSGTSYSLVHIPQLDSEPEYELSIGHADDAAMDEFVPIEDISAALALGQDKYLGETFLKVEEDYIILQVEEFNSVFENENFEIQVFLVDTIADNAVVDGTKEELISLGFIPETNKLENIDSNFVEHYFDVLVDQEIDDEILHRVNKKKGLYADKAIEHFDKTAQSDIYVRTVLDEEFEESC